MESDWTQTVFAQDVAEVSAYVIWINKIPHIVYTDVLQIFFTIASPALLALLFLTGFRCNQCGFNLWYQRQCAEAGIVLCPFFGYIYRLSVHINTLECVRNGDSFIHKVDGRPLQPQQLRKIGSGDTVYGAVYQAIHHNAQWTIDHDSSGNLIMLYGGDADLTKGQNGTDDYTLGKDGIHEADKKFSDKANNLLYVYTVGRCGVNQKTGEIDPNLDIDKAANQTYAANANYIIFRDIDLSTKEWTPLTFQGTMIGAKSANGEKIWNDDSSAINTSTKPTISNISVMQTGKLNVGEQMGVGFFSTISSEVSEKDIGLSTYTADKITAQDVSFTGVGSISGHDYIGGIAGSLGTASVAGLLNTTLGVASYLAFTVDSVTLNGITDGFSVSGNERVGGGFGDAIGGTIKTVSINNLKSVGGENFVGGFIGLSGPGELVGTDGGLTVNLLGLNYLLKLNNLLSLGQAVEVTITNANVNGIGDGFTVEATGVREENSVRDYTASGFMARSNSTKVENAHVTNLKSVTAANDGGYAAGFVAISKTGGLAEVGDDNSVKSLIEANGLVNAIGYLIPSYTTDALAIEKGKDYVTLVTCTPYGVNSHRLLVRGARIDYTPENGTAAAETETELSAWMKMPMQYRHLLLGLAVLAGILLLRALVVWIRKKFR